MTKPRPAVDCAAVDCLAVDWGTSNRRVFDLDADGGIIARREDARGILGIADFPAEIAALQGEADGRPLLLAGMIGSNRGWVEAPYRPAPATVADIASALVWPLPGVAIIPGVVQTGAAGVDVMRGEEVQLFGAVALTGNADGLFCHPGTHSKWISVAAGRISRFRTAMTGDIMAALSAQSILSDLLAMPADDDAAFVAGVDAMLGGGDLVVELFGVRARVLTGQLPPTAGSSRVSGILIGADIVAGLRSQPDGPVTIVGTPGLCRRFDLALTRAGRTSTIVDGESAFVAGAHAIWRAGSAQRPGLDR